MSFGSGLASGLSVGLALGNRIKESMNKRELAEAMKNATTEDKSSVIEVNKPDSQSYTLDSETGNYAPALAAIQGGTSAALQPVVEPQFEQKTERVAKQFATPGDRRTAMLQAGIDHLTAKGETDKALELEDKLEGQTLRRMQVKNALREDRKATEEEKDRAEYRAIADNFIGSRIYKENALAMAEYEKQNAAYQEALKANPAAAGQAPVKPSLRAVTAIDQLKDAAQHMQFNIAKGKASPAEALQFQQMVSKVKNEVSVDAFKKLHAGDVQGALDSFQSQGDVKMPEGATVTSRKVMHEVSGQKIPTHELVVTLPNGRTQVYNGLQGMEALDAADKVINTHFKGAEIGLKKQEVGIHGAGLALRQEEAGRAKEKWGIEKPELEARADETKGQRIARKELVAAVESGDAAAIQKAKAKAVASGIKFDTDAKLAHIPVKGMTGDTEGVMVFRDGQPQQFVTPADVRKAGGAALSYTTEKDAERAAKKGDLKSGDRVTINGVAGTWK